MPKTMVSIVLPTYNRAYILGDAIKSVLMQTYPYFELLIIDDGSADGTEELVMRYQDERIRYYKFEENAGQAKARNYGIELAEYDYIAFEDSDDIWHPEKLEVQMEAMCSASPEVGFAYHKIRYERDDGQVMVFPPESMAFEKKSGNIFAQLMYANLVPCPSIIAKKSCIAEVGGFDETMDALEDYDLVLKMARNHQALFLDRILLEAACSAGGVSASPAHFLVASCRLLQKYRQDYLDTNTLNHRIENILKNAEQIGERERFIRLIELSLR